MGKIVSNIDNLQILHEDNHLIIINKRSGDLVQGDKTGDTPLSDIVKNYIKEHFKKNEVKNDSLDLNLLFVEFLNNEDVGLFKAKSLYLKNRNEKNLLKCPRDHCTPPPPLRII